MESPIVRHVWSGTGGRGYDYPTASDPWPAPWPTSSSSTEYWLPSAASGIPEDPWPAPWPSSTSSTPPAAASARSVGYTIPEDPWPAPWPSSTSSTLPAAASGRSVGYTIPEDPWSAPWPSSTSSTLPSAASGRTVAYMISEDPWPAPWPSSTSSAASGRSVSVIYTTHEDPWPDPWPEYTSSPSSPTSGQSVVYKTKTVDFFGRLTPIVLPSETGPCALIAISNILLLRGEIDLASLAVDVSPAHLLSLIATRIIDSDCDIEVKDDSYISNREQDISAALDTLSRLGNGLGFVVKSGESTDLEFPRDQALFDIFNIGLYHGSVAEQQDIETIAANSPMVGLVHFEKGMSDCEYDGSSSVDFSTYNGQFVEQLHLKNPKQLTIRGLVCLEENLGEKELCVYLENNNVHTILKFNGDLCVLAKDQGCIDKPDLVWDRLHEIQIFVKSAHRMTFPWKHLSTECSKDFRHFVCLKVEPILTTIQSLKSMLTTYHWIPKENLLLVMEDGKIDLSEDSYTICESGIKDQDRVLACMENGSYTFYIYSCIQLGKFPVTVNSCFQTIGDVKKEIFRLYGYDLMLQVLTRYTDKIPLENEIPLVALGIVKPYMREMEFQKPRLKLVGPISRRKKNEGGILTRGGTLIPTCPLPPTGL